MKTKSVHLIVVVLLAAALVPMAYAQPPGMGRGRGRGVGGGTAQDQVKYHRLMADLIEAKAAETPDQDKIDKLTKELQEVQQRQPIAGPGPGRGYGWRGGRGGEVREAIPSS